MPSRTAPLPAYNYIVQIQKYGRDPHLALGGFSEVSGLDTEIHISEYRDGNDPAPQPRNIPGSSKHTHVHLKRGVVDSSDLWQWFTDTQTKGVAAQQDVTITLQDESGKAVQQWKLRNAVPTKYAGPALKGLGAGDVAMEDLELAYDGYEISPAS
jgi:phage tail-like protein